MSGKQFLTPKFWRKLFSMTFIGISGGATFCGICFYKGNEKFYSDFVMPLARKLDPETAHRIGVLMAKYCIASSDFQDPPCLKTKLLHLELSNPLGIAAGFDKQGEGMLGLYKMGFGFCEVGSITPKPQPGNPTPRVFRLEEDKAIINRYGFNSEGHDVVYDRLKRMKPKLNGRVLGVNLGKNKDSADAVSDYVQGIHKFADVADYFVVNVSSPNTPGLRSLQKGSAFRELVDSAIEARNCLSNKMPLLLKISPDLTSEEQQIIAEEVLKRKKDIDGLIVSNTTISRSSSLVSHYKNETGGLSGEPLKKLATESIKRMYSLTKGEVLIIGVGGISSGQDAYEKIRAGASLLQLYTALTYAGPPIVTRIKEDLAECLKNDGYSSVSEAVGKDADLISSSTS